MINLADIQLAATCCDTALDAAMSYLAPTPCPTDCITSAITLLIIASDYANQVLELASVSTDGTTTTPPASCSVT